jgi:DOPA 4,5-dioxygenase
MYQVAFGIAEFPRFVPWLMLNRQGLAILIHPNTLNERRDHLVHPLWLGEMLPILHEEQLTEIKEEEAVDPIIPNTTPHLTA